MNQSCMDGVYVQHEKSQVVQTSWVVLAMMAAEYPETAVIERGIKVTV